MKSVDVVAGLILQEELLLVCQRKENATFPLKWEFPGGKVEKAETGEDALRRELKEELGIEADKFSELFLSRHTYADELAVTLRFYRVDSFAGVPTNIAFQRLKWAKINELSGMDFLDGDLPLINLLVSSQGRILFS
jgi:8-oxo-dGTP diphosphatase